MKKKIYTVFILSILLISCSNYTATDPMHQDADYDIYSIPENVDQKYLIKADAEEGYIENIMQQYFDEHGSYIIFLSDTKDNINSNNTIAKINNIIKKNKYIRGTALDLSRTDIELIADNAFQSNQNLANIKLPNTIKTIGSNSFSSCTSLRTINFPSSIIEIKQEAFISCKSLYSADISKTKITIINIGTFNDCSSLTSVILPETINVINVKAFYDCISLQTINIPSKSKLIGGSAFYNCKSLKSIKLNNELTNISGYAFFYCSSLEKISLPSSLTKMQGDYTFSGCTSLKSVEYLGSNSAGIDAASNLFNKYNDQGAISVPASSPSNLYLPNVKEDPSNKSWDNFLGYNWKSKGKINYNTKMPQ